MGQTEFKVDKPITYQYIIQHIANGLLIKDTDRCLGSINEESII